MTKSGHNTTNCLQHIHEKQITLIQLQHIPNHFLEPFSLLMKKALESGYECADFYQRSAASVKTTTVTGTGTGTDRCSISYIIHIFINTRTLPHHPPLASALFFF